jgi:xanthine dehydrogenase molybdopterin-binding subunit B
LTSDDCVLTAVVKSTQALAEIISIDPSPALSLPGVTGFLSASDIPAGGKNEVYGAPLFAACVTEYVGQPLGIILADSADLAEHAANRVSVTYGPPPAGKKAVITIQDAITAGSWYDDPYSLGRKLSRSFGGDVSSAIADAEHKIEGGCYSLPSQQHMYMETQVAVAVPGEEGELTVYSSTQSLDAVQKAVAEVVGVGYHQVNVGKWGT